MEKYKFIQGVKSYFVFVTLVLTANTSFASVIEFNMLSPAYNGCADLNQTVGGRTGVATLRSGPDNTACPTDPAGSIFENTNSLGVAGSQLKDIIGFSFDYSIAPDSNMAGGARMMLYVYQDEARTDFNGVLQFDQFWKLEQTPGEWFSVSNFLSSSAGNASNNTNDLYTGYKSWSDIVADHGDQYWYWAGILQDNPNGSTFSVDNVSISVVANEVPAPATLTLFLLCFIGLMLRRKSLTNL